jgi:hypothetical protein
MKRAASSISRQDSAATEVWAASGVEEDDTAVDTPVKTKSLRVTNGVRITPLPDSSSITAETPAPAAAAAVVRRKSSGKKAPSPHAGPAMFSTGLHVPVTWAQLAQQAAAAPKPPGATRVLSWNVNGIRAALKDERRADVVAWVAAEAPDVLCIQVRGA